MQRRCRKKGFSLSTSEETPSCPLPLPLAGQYLKAAFINTSSRHGSSSSALPNYVKRNSLPPCVIFLSLFPSLHSFLPFLSSFFLFSPSILPPFLRSSFPHSQETRVVVSRPTMDGAHDFLNEHQHQALKEDEPNYRNRKKENYRKIEVRKK